MDARGDRALVVDLGDREELHLVPKFVSGADVLGGDLRDALAMNIPRHWSRATAAVPRDGAGALSLTAWGWSSRDRGEADRLARERLGYARSNEVVIRFESRR